MKYAKQLENGTVELREDSYNLSDDCVLLTDDQFKQLESGEYVFIDGVISEQQKHDRSVV